MPSKLRSHVAPPIHLKYIFIGPLRFLRSSPAGFDFLDADVSPDIEFIPGHRFRRKGLDIGIGYPNLIATNRQT
ncbi:MAG: hypothetical protein OEZ34_12970 [Spirochaetia bacterium]|nr:hypothetical protein [Spirochaetia bacterium]